MKLKILRSDVNVSDEIIPNSQSSELSWQIIEGSSDKSDVHGSQDEKDETTSSSSADEILSSLLHKRRRTFSPISLDRPRIKQFDLGEHYDPNIVKTIDLINNARNTEKVTYSDDEDESLPRIRKELEAQLIQGRASSEYINMLIHETSSRRFRDWHFFIHDNSVDEGFIAEILQSSEAGSFIKQHYETLDDIVIALGGQNLGKIDISRHKYGKTYDTLNLMLPMDLIFELVGYYHDDENYVRYILCIALDQNIFEMCDLQWFDAQLQHIVESRISTWENIADDYLSLVDQNDFYMHFKILRQVYSLREVLISRLVPENLDITNIFGSMLKQNLFEELLYFTLFAAWSHKLPDSKGTLISYLRRCMDDVVHDAIEVHLIRSLLNLLERLVEKDQSFSELGYV